MGLFLIYWGESGKFDHNFFEFLIFLRQNAELVVKKLVGFSQLVKINGFFLQCTVHPCTVLQLYCIRSLVDFKTPNKKLVRFNIFKMFVYLYMYTVERTYPENRNHGYSTVYSTGCHKKRQIDDTEGVR